MTFFYFLLAFSFLIGAVVGSFLNVVALRYNSGKTIFGRSQCFSCSMELSWLDLVPIASFLILRGRCRSCKSAVSLQYPIVEFITGLLFLLISYKLLLYNTIPYTLNPIFSILYYWILWSLLIVISIYDLHHKIIPNGLVYSFALFALAKLAAGFIIEGGSISLILHSLLAGPIAALPFAALWGASGGRWMGLGDAKLALGIGWLFGLAGALTAIMLSFWMGAISGFALILRSRLLERSGSITMKSELPFGPFLAAGTALTFLADFNLMEIFKLH